MSAKATRPLAFLALGLPVSIVIVLTVLLSCIGGFILLILDCDRDIKSPPQAVDISPLVALEWSSDVARVTDVLDPKGFKSYDIKADGVIVDGAFSYPDTSSFLGVTHANIWIMALSSIDSAKESFMERCSSWGSYHDRSKFTYGEAGDTQYCISYVREARESTSGLCLPTGVYESLVVIRKRNVVIVIDEGARDRANMHANDAIKQLAEAFASQKSGDGDK